VLRLLSRRGISIPLFIVSTNIREILISGTATAQKIVVFSDSNGFAMTRYNLISGGMIREAEAPDETRLTFYQGR
jgi:hypothetical protein